MSIKNNEELNTVLLNLMRLGFTINKGRIQHIDEMRQPGGFKIFISPDVDKYRPTQVEEEKGRISFFALTRAEDFDLPHNARIFKTNGLSVNSAQMVFSKKSDVFYKEGVGTLATFVKKHSMFLQNAYGAYIDIKTPSAHTLIYDALVVGRSDTDTTICKSLRFSLCSIINDPTDVAFIVVFPVSFMNVHNFIKMAMSVLGLPKDQEAEVHPKKDYIVLRKLNGTAKLKLLEKDRVRGKTMIDLLSLVGAETTT